MLAETPSKKAIALHLGLDRSTVSKILNNYDVEKFATETVDRVKQAAQDLGYVRSQRRLHARKPVKGLAEIEVVLAKDGSVFSKGLVYLHDLSLSGVRVDILEMDKGAFPIAPFQIRLKVVDAAGLAGLALAGRPVRLDSRVSNRLLGLGIEFDGVEEPARKELKDYLAISLN